VGGGTAGWMTAAALAAVAGRSVAEVHLVESEEIGIVGVGEATLPHIRAFNTRLGIDEAEFMRATSATFKLGIEFCDWARIGDSYIHPFGAFGHDVDGVGFHHYLSRAGQIATLPEYSLPVVAARHAKFAPPLEDPRSLLSTFGYAYQFDATRYAPFLRARAERWREPKDAWSMSNRAPRVMSWRSCSTTANELRATCSSTARGSDRCYWDRRWASRSRTGRIGCLATVQSQCPAPTLER
jgi:hypothetical protein